MIVQCINDAPVQAPGDRTTAVLTICKEYAVYGIGVRKRDAMNPLAAGITYLIACDDELPRWCDASRFETIDPVFPSGWGFRFFGPSRWPGEEQLPLWTEEGAAEGVIGYPELVNDPRHYIGLETREASDIEIFERRRREIDAGLSSFPRRRESSLSKSSLVGSGFPLSRE
ncbi:MAG: hypothetical protein L6Q71_01985 [Planctomycetes bacterium]|nr:hypothetical protein [Planctomycetota bacterium]NUQ33309.1 hypothetical protein [Planctomycetaceae bacterium]